MTSIYRSDDARRLVEDQYREFLDSWAMPSVETTIPTRQGDTFVIACGPDQAPPLVLLHGAGFNSTSWRSDVAVLARAHRAYAVDLIGEPGFSAPSRPSLASDAYARWLDDVLDGLGLKEAAFVGASLGGWIALDYALRRPERVTRLALLAPGGIGRQKYGAIIGSVFLVPFGHRGRRAAARLILGPRNDPSNSPDESTLRALHEYLLLIQRSYFPRRDRLPTFTDDQLRALDVPLLVIAGEKDRMLDSGATARRVREFVPDASVTLLPGAGHIPTGYADAVAHFLRSET